MEVDDQLHMRYDPTLHRIEKSGSSRMKGATPNLQGRAEAMLNESFDDFLMPDDIRWCPSKLPFTTAHVTPIRRKFNKHAEVDDTLSDRYHNSHLSMPSMKSATDPAASNLKSKKTAKPQKSVFDARRKLVQSKMKRNSIPHSNPQSQNLGNRHRRTKSTARRKQKPDVEDSQKKLERPGSAPLKSQLPKVPRVASAAPRPPVAPDRHDKVQQPVERKPKPPPKSAKAILEDQLKAMRNRNRRNLQVVRSTKEQFERVREEQKEIERKLYDDLRGHLQCGELRRRPGTSSESRPRATHSSDRPQTTGATSRPKKKANEDDSEGSADVEADEKSKENGKERQQPFERHVSTAASRNRAMLRCVNCKRVFRSAATLAMHRTTCDLARGHGVAFNSNNGARLRNTSMNRDELNNQRPQSADGKASKKTGHGGTSADDGAPEENTRMHTNEEKRRWQERFREWQGSTKGGGGCGQVPMNEFYMRNYGPWSSDNYLKDEKDREEGRKKAAAEAERLRVEILRKQVEERSRRDIENDKMVLLVHNLRWKEFLAKAKAGKPICYTDIPWLPTLARSFSVHKSNRGRVEKTELFDVIGVPESASDKAKKAALRAASLRWHPDKFLQAYGKLIVESDHERVMDQVNIMCQRINQLKSRFDSRSS